MTAALATLPQASTPAQDVAVSPTAGGWFATPTLWWDFGNPRNPFAPAKRRPALMVMMYLVTHAPYKTGRSGVRGELTTTLTELADASGGSRSGALRIVEWLQELGMIRLIDKKPQLKIAIVNYDEFGKKRTTPKETSNPSDASHAKQNFGTAEAPREVPNTVTISSVCKDLENHLEKNWNSGQKTGTANGTFEIPRRIKPTMQDKSEIQDSSAPQKNAVEEKVNGKLPFIKESLKETLKEEQECGDRKTGPRAPAKEPSAFETEIATMWDAWVKSRGHKRIPIKSQYEGIRKLTKLDGYTEAEMREVLTWIQQHDFWPGAVLSLLALRERKNGVAKIETILEQMRRDKERAAKRQADEQARKAAQKPKSIFDVYKRL